MHGVAAAAFATFLGFARRPDGHATLFVELSQKVAVAEAHTSGKLIYKLAGVSAPDRVVRLPLLTSTFGIPISSARLVQTKEGVDLVVDIASQAHGAVRFVEMGRGAWFVVEVSGGAVELH